MKKKILSLILCLCLAIGGLVFASCGDSGYDIAKFSQEYDELVKDKSYAKLDTNGFIIIEYTDRIIAKIGEEGAGDDETAQNSNPPYSYLTTVYKNLTANSQEFIIYRKAAVSKTTEQVSNEVRVELKNGLADFNTALVEIGENIDELDKELEVNAGEEVYLARFALLTSSFAKMYSAAGRITNTMSKVLGEENYNYYENKATFDANGKLLSTLKGNIKKHISMLTQNFVTMHVDGVGTKLPETYADYQTQINDLNDSYDSIQDNTFAVNGSGGEAFNQAVRLYNVTSQLINNRDMYFKACETINYIKATKVDADNTEEEKLCLNIIEGYKASLNEYTSVLNKIVQVLVGA